MMSGGGQTTMRCYYEVLEVERNASADELKKAYRKKALLWHPDRNIHQPELAHERFQELQQAYDVLSDPHERAWYDDHREAILRGGDGTAEEGAQHGINLWPFFNNSCFSGYNDGPKGFYTVYGGLFAKLAEEEEEAAANKKQKNGSQAAPAFGDLSTPYPAVKEFYSYWLNFVTLKNFAWCDQYKTTEAPNRQIRRLMEKENKKCRDKERRLFNEQVRHLVEHVRKKDKRVIEHLIKTKQETEQKREKELLRKKQQEEERQAARELQEAEELQHLENFQEEWDKLGLDDIYSPEELSRGKKNKKGKGKDVQAAADAVDAKHMDGEAELFCPACKKSFKSERSYQNHEKSKKHLANVKKLERELLEAALAAEDEETEEDEEDEGAKGEEDMQKHGNDSEHSEEFVVLGDANSSFEKEQREADGQESEDDEEEEWEMLLRYQQQSRRFSTGSQDEDEEEEEEEEEAENEKDEGSADTDATSNTNKANEQEENESAPESSAKENGLDEDEEEEVEAKTTKETAKPFTKKERRMLRKMRKKDSRAATNSSPATSSSEDNALRCKTCSVTFRSRNKLFQHIKQTGHAAFKK